MTLRRRLLLAQVPLAAALLVVGAASLRTVASLGDSSETILQDNYRSVLAAQRMGDALDGLDREALLRALGRPAGESARRAPRSLRVGAARPGGKPHRAGRGAGHRSAANRVDGLPGRRGASRRPPGDEAPRLPRARCSSAPWPCERPSTRCSRSTRTRWCARATRRAAPRSACSSSCWRPPSRPSPSASSPPSPSPHGSCSRCPPSRWPCAASARATWSRGRAPGARTRSPRSRPSSTPWPTGWRSTARAPSATSSRPSRPPRPPSTACPTRCSSSTPPAGS